MLVLGWKDAGVLRSARCESRTYRPRTADRVTVRPPLSKSRQWQEPLRTVCRDGSTELIAFLKSPIRPATNESSAAHLRRGVRVSLLSALPCSPPVRALQRECPLVCILPQLSVPRMMLKTPASGVERRALRGEGDRGITT
jgi:hypothetical protein